MRLLIVILVNMLLALAAAGTGIQAAPTAPSIQWTKRFAVPRAARTTPVASAIGPDDSIYFTGWTRGREHPDDWVTARFSKTGKLLWSTVFDGGTFEADDPSALVVDNENNVYVTGFCRDTCTTIKYDQEGNEVWNSRYFRAANTGAGGSAIALGPDGSVYVGGWEYVDTTERTNALLLKYDSAGNLLWNVGRNGSLSGGDVTGAIAIGKSGAVFVTGTANLNAGEPDFFTARYEPDGSEAWYREFDGPANHKDASADVVIDALDNVIVTGVVESTPSGDGSDIATLKYSPDGELLWSAIVDGEAHLSDGASNVAVHSDGSIYVGAYVTYHPGDPAIAVLKYSPDGTLDWTTRYQYPGSTENWAYSLALDRDGSAYLTGVTRIHGQADTLTLKYSSTGALSWSARYAGSSPSADAGITVAVDGERNVVVCGQYGANDKYGFAALKYGSSNGVPVADAGAKQSITTSDLSTSVARDASASRDLDGDPLTFRWLEDSTLLGIGESVTAELSLGTHVITLEATDGFGAVGRDLTQISIVAPASTTGARVTGSGAIDTPGGVARFSVDARAARNGRAAGSLSYTLPDGTRLRSSSLSSVVTEGNRAAVFGQLKGGGRQAIAFLLTVEDLGDPGAGVDTFRLQLSNRSAPITGTLSEGDLTVVP